MKGKGLMRDEVPAQRLESGSILLTVKNDSRTSQLGPLTRWEARALLSCLTGALQDKRFWDESGLVRVVREG